MDMKGEGDGGEHNGAHVNEMHEKEGGEHAGTKSTRMNGRGTNGHALDITGGS